VTLDVFTADGKPKPGAGMFGGVERVKYFQKNFFGMPPPVSSTRTVFIFYF
jgi:hypothetical protein